MKINGRAISDRLGNSDVNLVAGCRKRAEAIRTQRKQSLNDINERKLLKQAVRILDELRLEAKAESSCFEQFDRGNSKATENVVVSIGERERI